jgi:hypothetical protein
MSWGSSDHRCEVSKDDLRSAEYEMERKAERLERLIDQLESRVNELWSEVHSLQEQIAASE